jgi:hypothetical protein
VRTVYSVLRKQCEQFTAFFGGSANSPQRSLESETPLGGKASPIKQQTAMGAIATKWPHLNICDVYRNTAHFLIYVNVAHFKPTSDR